MCLKGQGNLAQITQFTCTNLLIQHPLQNMIWIRSSITRPDLSLITLPLETWNSWEEQFMLNKLPETSSSGNQPQCIQGSGSRGEWEEEGQQLAQTGAGCCCRGYLLSITFSSSDFVRTLVISAFSIRSARLAGLPFCALCLLMDSSST